MPSKRRRSDVDATKCSRINVTTTSLPGWSGGAKVLGKLSVPGRPSNLAYSRARAYCAFSRCGWGCLDIFSLIFHSSFLSPSLWETARYRLKYCLKGPLSPKQPTNQPTTTSLRHHVPAAEMGTPATAAKGT